MTIRWNAVEQHFTVILFGSQFSPVCNFELGNVRSEFFNFIQFVISEHLSSLDLALLRAKRLIEQW